MASKGTKTYGIIFGLLILAIFVYNLRGQKMEIQQINTTEPEWLQKYVFIINQENISREYLAETDYYDYSDPLIQARISQLLTISKNPKEYTENAAELVFINIDYDRGATDFECVNGAASTNFIAGKGDCTEQGMSLIALLRGAGIPARAVGGCLYKDRSSRCDLFAAVPFKTPRYTEITQDDIAKGVFSRRQGIGSRKGGLHLFLEVFIPNEFIGDSMILDKSRITKNGAWIVVEPTTGEIVDEDSCYLYDEELIVPDDRKDLFCSSDNVSYAISCSQR